MSVYTRFAICILFLLAQSLLLAGCSTPKTVPAWATVAAYEKAKPAPLPKACVPAKGGYRLPDLKGSSEAETARFTDGVLNVHGKLLSDYYGCSAWTAKRNE